MQNLHELNEDDSGSRLDFCERNMASVDGGQIALEWVLFSDEATLTLPGHANRCRYWADENPYWMLECHNERPQKTNIWAGIFGDNIVGPLFFNENLTGQIYLTMLQDELVPALAILFPNNLDPDLFPQGRAPQHFAQNVRNISTKCFRIGELEEGSHLSCQQDHSILPQLDFFMGISKKQGLFY